MCNDHTKLSKSLRLKTTSDSEGLSISLGQYIHCTKHIFRRPYAKSITYLYVNGSLKRKKVQYLQKEN